MKAYNYAIRNRLGLGRAMDKELGGLGSQWLRHSGQLAKYLIGGAFAYHLVDNLMEDTIGLGIGDIGAKLYQGANLAVSTLSYVTGLTAIRRAQEKVSPDSTSKLAVLAYPASGAITGAVIAGALNAKDRFKFGPAALERISEKTPFKGLMSLVFKSEYTRIGRFARTGGAIGAIASALISLPFGIGSIGHKYTPGELLDIYRGKEEVPVRKARFWEFGRTPWQGGQIQYYRPHWSVVAQTRYKEKALFDKDESFLFRAIKQTEILKDIVAPYYLEDSHGTDRPYPIAVGHSTGLGPLSAIYNLTLAKLFKPQRFQYVDKWQSGDDPSLWGTDRDAAGMAAAVDYTKRVTLRPGNLLSESENLAQRIGDAFGLPGFIAESLNENILGRRTWLGQQAVLQPSADMNSAQRNFWDLSLGGGATTCFKPNTMIKTELGCKFIQDIEPGDMILNQDGYKKVINKVKKIGSEFITVKTSILPRIFTCTTNHWIPIVRRHTYKNGHPKPFIPKNIDFLEIQAKDLKLDDLLLYPIDYTEEIAIIDLKNGGKCFTENWVYYQASHDFAKAYELLEINPDLTRKDFRQLGIPDLIGKEALRQFRQNQCPKRCKRFYVIDKDLAWFLGWYIAEGCANSRNGQIQLTMNKNELVFAERLVAIIFDKFDSRAKISIEHNTLHLVFNHSALTSYLQAFGTKAPKKHIPLILKRMPRSILESLLAGLIEGDGSGSFSEGQFSFGSSSAELVKDVADSLLKLGIHCCTNLDFLEISKGLYPQGTPRKNCKRSYLISRDGRFDWKFFNGCYLIPVSDLEISCELAQDVYDLTIEDLHYYTAEGVLVHNTEFIRRLIPPKRSQALSINTIPNTSMPSWMPDTYMKLHQGDPFTKLLQGELRLPGKGFEARYPELSGVTPEDYPLAYRAKILSDVAPFSREFETLKQQGLAYSDSMSSREQFIFNQALKQADAKRNERLFADDPKNIFQWLNLKIKTIGRMNPIEHLIPLAPVHKFAGPISAIEDYKLNMIYSKEFTSWAHPFDSFVFPALKVAAHDLGWDGVPRDVREKRTIQEYFDRLEYLKYKTMARQAPFTGDPMESARYALASQKTLTGLNPFGTESNIYQALEGREEYYYIPFKNETNPRKQQKILELIPDQYKKIYRAAWAEKAAMSGDKEAIQQLTLLKQAKGEEINDKLIQQYKAETGNESLRYYAEWKRLQDTQEFFLENGLAIPDKNWAGFDPRVRMTDVKMRYVMEHGKDIHDFDLWESDQIGIDSRPWSAEAAEQLEDPDTRNPNILSMNLQSMFHTLGFRNVNVSVEEIIGFNRLSEVDMEFEHDRSRFTNPMAKFGY
jgi:intein/homing endonuclease